MSVISEAQIGDQIVIINHFVACKFGEEFEWGKEKEFPVGEIVEYVDWFKNSNTTQDHLSWHIKFKTISGEMYDAVQLYFVTMDERKDILAAIKGS
ncbi:hypothetical protein [Fusibacter sp. JL216-2]|uniref:hypothetical protein n=1 Tax=Fusibacter sp. JL216-2 TaxID=3071453 RepID=UPI003D33603F